MSAHNPNHPTTRVVEGQWHKLAALLVQKAGGHVVLTMSDVIELGPHKSIVVQELDDGIHLTIVDNATAKLLAAREKESDDERHERLEREHLGDPEKRTGIYAPKADADGWIRWKGGECPVPLKTNVDVMFADASLRSSIFLAGELNWHHGQNGRYDIVAYRVVHEGGSK